MLKFDKKRGNDGIKDSYSHMSPSRGGSSQGTFFETYGNPSFGRYFLCYKKGLWITHSPYLLFLQLSSPVHRRNRNNFMQVSWLWDRRFICLPR